LLKVALNTIKGKNKPTYIYMIDWFLFITIFNYKICRDII
jgi:hypothetical protein